MRMQRYRWISVSAASFGTFQRVAVGCIALCLAFLAGAQSGVQSEEEYVLGPDSQFNPAVPHGVVTKHTLVSGPDSVFPGTVRDYWTYVPQQYDGSRAAALMVFQDGGGYVTTNGAWRVPWVFDNLIARGEMPVTLGVFVNPGVLPSLRGTNALPRFNRSYEYDGMGPNYARFLAEELLPDVFAQTRVFVTPDPNLRAIGGASSGAIAAFTAAWERPDLFRRVFSTIGTYVGLRGGNDYPTLVRKFEPKPLRVFLQGGYNDLNIYGGNWWIANQDMYSALQWAGYDVERKWGMGGHNSRHGASIFPEAMRWLWRDSARPIQTRVSTNSPLNEILLPDSPWELLGQGYGFPGGLCPMPNGEIFFADMNESRVYRVLADGNVRIARHNTSGAQAIALHPDGSLIASQPDGRRIVRYTGTDNETFLNDDTFSKDVIVGHNGVIYFTDPRGRSVKMLDDRGRLRVVGTDIEYPSGLCLSPDQSLLFVSDLVGQFIHSFQIQNDGTLAYGQPYHHLHLPDDPRGSGADGMAVDTDGRLYVATHLGIQVCDQAGRVLGIIAKPEPGAWASDVTFGGPRQDTLYLTAGDKIWRRKTRVQGVLPHQAPVLPRPPRL